MTISAALLIVIYMIHAQYIQPWIQKGDQISLV